MHRLKSRQKQIPNGFTFRIPQLNWDSRKTLGLHPSFDTLVRAVIAARRGNPHQTQKHGWSLDPATVAEEVEQFQVKVCLANGWMTYLTESGGGAPAPFSQPPSPQEQKRLGAAAAKARKLWAGLKTLNDWHESEEPAVPQAQSEQRASVCVKCPYNNTNGDLFSFFTTTAAAGIKRQIEKFADRKLATTLDDKLGVCAQDEKDGNGGCLCVNKLSVHTPIELKLKHMMPETKAALHPSCWVLSEEKEIGVTP